MSPPRWFVLSPVKAPIGEVFAKTASLRALHQFVPQEVGRLEHAPRSSQMEFQADSVQRLRADDEPLKIASAWDGLVVNCFIKSIRASLYLYFWRWGDSTGLGVELDDQVPFVEPAGMAQGEWLERFMCSYVEACGATACANGRDEHGREWPQAIEPLDPSQLIARWRQEGLPKPPARGFYMLTQELLRTEEIAALREQSDSRARAWLRYFQTPTGYHVLSTWSRRNWWAT